MLSGVYLDDEFKRRGFRMGLTATVCVAFIVLFVAFIIWATRQP